jgi:energy-coupling factor transporter ATP-binding protein EcfA2
MILSTYLKFLQEGYIISEKTISVDLYKFENKKSDTLLIVGVAGSGKTTLGKYLSKKYKVKYYTTDELFDRTILNMEERWNVVMKGIPKLVKKKERKIIEGISLIGYMYIKKTTPTSIKMWKQPVIILGKSALKGSIDAYKRGKKFSILKNFKVFMRQLNRFKQDRPNIPASIVEDFDIPKIKLGV